MFKLVKKDEKTEARVGELRTAHGIIETPTFMPVGTLATVKSVSPDELKRIDAQIILGNTYHLYLRPGMEVIETFGGLHNFMRWNAPILTDSGGFQVFSLAKLRQIDKGKNGGVRFNNHLDGSEVFLTPEKSLEIQAQLGSDIAMLFDVCPPAKCSHSEARTAMQITHNWALRSKIWLEKNIKKTNNSTEDLPKRQLHFGIAQGAIYEDLRKESIAFLADLDFDGYALGGLSVGEEEVDLLRIASASAPLLPESKARYGMGLAKPHQLLELVEAGLDMFDCVLPTRVARTGTAFTMDGTLNLKNAVWQKSEKVLENDCECPSCVGGFTRAYIRHLLKSDEILGLRLVTLHNLFFFIDLMKRARHAIINNCFAEFKSEACKRLTSNKFRISQ